LHLSESFGDISSFLKQKERNWKISRDTGKTEDLQEHYNRNANKIKKAKTGSCLVFAFLLSFKVEQENIQTQIYHLFHNQKTMFD
jgi:hypothetical protein